LILADTDVLIDYLANVQPFADIVRSFIASDELQTSVITYFELLSGARRDSRGDRTRRLVALLPVLPLDRDAAERASVVRQELERTGQGIGMADSLIAGIALANQLPLLTRNRRHFERVPALILVPA
jgi:predicted nucleic acid-binding protein